MAALSELGIDNVVVKINSSELPALDGSSYEYVKKIISSGIKAQNKWKKIFQMLVNCSYSFNFKKILGYKYI